MPGSRLSVLQRRILEALAGQQPPFVLTGGGALAGFHLGHRETRDLDLFWRGAPVLGGLPREIEERLRAVGLEVQSIQTAATFHKLRVSEGGDVCLVDLVAERAAAIEDPVPTDLGGASILVDSRHEILVNKLCALLGRAELRDLRDVKALLDEGGDLGRALADAPRKDGGFSPLTLAWLLREFPLHGLARDEAMGEHELTALDAFRKDLIDRLLARTAPE